MPPFVASCVFAVGIAGLFYLDRDPSWPKSTALWLPAIWVMIGGSRPASVWLGIAPTTGDTNLDGSPFDRLVFSFIVTMAILVVVRRRRTIAPLLRANWPLILFFGYCALSICWSDYPEVAFKRYTKAIGELALVLIVLSDVDPEKALKQLVSRVGFILLPASILLIRYYPALGRMYGAGDNVSDPWTVMYTGVAQTKNFLGLITMVSALGAVWRLQTLYVDKKNPFRRRQMLAQGLLLFAAFWLLSVAQSATSLSCFVIGSALLTVTTLPRLAQRPSLRNLVAVACLALPLIALFASSGAGLLGAVGRNSTLTGRTEIWHEVLQMAPNPTVGAGFESFWLGARLQAIWARHWWHPNEAHDGYIEMYLNLGWIGLALLGIMLFTGYRNVTKALRDQPTLGSVKLAYFIVTIVYSLTESAIRTLNPLWYFFLVSMAATPIMALEPVPTLSPMRTNFDRSTRAILRPRRLATTKGNV